MTGRRPFAALVAVAAVVLTACSAIDPVGAGAPATVPATAPTSASPTASPSPTVPPARPSARHLLAGMPPMLDPHDVYAADRPGMLSPVVRSFPARIYVPNSNSNTVTVIDPRTYRVIGTYPVGREPQHVVPSWDLKTLWVNNDLGNSLTPIDPRTGRFGRPVRVHDPYNLYFTPNGRYAVVMASADREIVFRDPHTMAVRKVLHVPCFGVNHADFSADGTYFIVSCEFSSELLKVDTARMRLLDVLRIPGGGMPQDVKLAPDGHAFYVADMMRGGVWVVDGQRFRIVKLVPTGVGAHGEYISRNSRVMYVSNRADGSISVFDVRHDRVLTTWHIPGGGSPDMGGLSANGKVLWLAGRYDAVVYAISTADGHLIAKIPVGQGPHGLCVYPQPGRYSLGHTGVFR